MTPKDAPREVLNDPCRGPWRFRLVLPPTVLVAVALLAIQAASAVNVGTRDGDRRASWSPAGSRIAEIGPLRVDTACPWNRAAVGDHPQSSPDLSRPQWSRDGRSIAFLSGGNVLWRIGIDGRGLRRLTTMVENASLKPDWSLLVYTGRGLCTARIDGTRRKPLTGESDLSPTWSPDGGRIAFARVQKENVFQFGYESWIHILGPDGTALHQVSGRRAPVREEDADSWYPLTYDRQIAWSRDGRRLAVSGQFCLAPGDLFQCDPYVHETILRLFVINTDGTGRRDLTKTYWNEVITAPRDPAWSHDGRRIVFAAKPAIPTTPGKPVIDVSSLYVINNDGTGLRKLVEPAPGGTACAARRHAEQYGDGEGDPAISPDGRWIAFACRYAAKGRSNIYLVAASGGVAKPLIRTR